MLSNNYCCRGKRISVMYSESVSVAFVFQNANCVPPYYIAICDLFGLTNFSTLPHKRHDFPKNLTQQKNMCFDFLYKLCLKYFSF